QESRDEAGFHLGLLVQVEGVVTVARDANARELRRGAERGAAARPQARERVAPLAGRSHREVEDALLRGLGAEDVVARLEIPDRARGLERRAFETAGEAHEERLDAEARLGTASEDLVPAGGPDAEENGERAEEVRAADPGPLTQVHHL